MIHLLKGNIGTGIFAMPGNTFCHQCRFPLASFCYKSANIRQFYWLVEKFAKGIDGFCKIVNKNLP